MYLSETDSWIVARHEWQFLWYSFIKWVQRSGGRAVCAAVGELFALTDERVLLESIGLKSSSHRV